MLGEFQNRYSEVNFLLDLADRLFERCHHCTHCSGNARCRRILVEVGNFSDKRWQLEGGEVWAKFRNLGDSAEKQNQNINAMKKNAENAEKSETAVLGRSFNMTELR